MLGCYFFFERKGQGGIHNLKDGPGYNTCPDIKDQGIIPTLKGRARVYNTHPERKRQGVVKPALKGRARV